LLSDSARPVEVTANPCRSYDWQTALHLPTACSFPTTDEDFAPKIRESGGTVVRTLPGLDIGAGGKRYYIISRVD